VDFRLLGQVEVWHDGHLLPLGPRQRAVLAVLLHRANSVVARSEIVRLAWGDRLEDRPATVDRMVADYVSHLRTAFREAGALGQVRLVARRPGFAVEVDSQTVDWHRFRALYGQARAAWQTADLDDAARLLRQALGLWRGSALADLAGRSLDPIRRELDDQRLAAAEDLGRVELDRGRPGEVVDLLSELAAGHPGRERLAALLVRALHAAGRRDQAIAVYQRTRAYLTGDLGLDPTDVLEDAYKAVLHGRPPIPLAAEPGRLAQLPADTASFTGRRSELADLLTLVPDISTTGDATGGVVMICAVDGMAGVGKTALAVHAAHRLAARFPDGCLFIDLHGYTRQVAPVEAGPALERLLRALGVPSEQIPPDLDDRAALYRTRLAGKRMLVVLDNARTAEQVRPLLPGEIGCRVVVTSRRRLTALDEARPLTVDLLPLADAVALFGKVAGAGRVTGHADTVERLVELCGRLPLAIRIAAARLRARPAWTVPHLADQLADQHATLGELDDGERSVAAAFTLSYRDLTGDQQRMFRRLGLHPGADTDRYAAAALAGLSLARVSRLLEDLLDAHLLTQAVPGRYRFHDLVRAYAADLTNTGDDQDERRAAVTGLFDHYLATAAAAMDTLHPAEQHRRPRIPAPDSPTPPLADSAAAHAWLDAERANLVAACAHTAAHGWPGHTTRLAAILSRYLDVGGHYLDALTIHTHARDAAGHTGDRAAEAAALTSIGLVYLRLTRYPEAVRQLERALVLERQIGDQVGEARTLSSLGLVEQRLGRFRRAAARHRVALSLVHKLGDRFAEAGVSINLAMDERLLGRYPAAVDHLLHALEIFRQLDNRLGEATALNNLGATHARQGLLRQAIDEHLRALALSREIGFQDGMAHALTNLGEVYRRQGRYLQAVDHHQQARALFDALNDHRGEAAALNGLGEAELTLGSADQARAHHAAALVLAKRIGDPFEEARAHNGLALTHHTTGEHDQARPHWQHALALYTGLDAPEADDVRDYLAALNHLADDGHVEADS
jgi:DNA-binding SARP family transcriptional activator/Flp pilus assembly protein TadD